MSLPLGDWQFWVVTVAAIVALALITRSLWPKRRKPKRTHLTIGGKRI